MRRLTTPLFHPTKKNIILLFALYTLVFAFFTPDITQWLTGYQRILTNQTYLMHDFIEVGGTAAAFINVALHFVIAYYLMLRNTRSNLSGLQIAAIGIFVGHSFFGTHILNIIPIIVGVILYSRWTGQSFSVYTTVSLFATAAGPFVSYWALAPGVSLFSIAVASAFGIGIGFISAPLAEQYLKFHHGFTLYNFGFTMGIIAMFASFTFVYFNQTVPSVRIISSAAHHYLVWYIAIVLCLLLLFASFYFKEIITQYPRLLKSTGRTPDDFTSKFGYPTVAFNMACNGFIYLVIALLIGTSFSGPVVGGFCAVIGFSSFGKHPFNCLPISFGLGLAALAVGTPLDHSQLLIALLFSTTLCPIAGYYGIIYGILAGFLHYNMLNVVFTLHQGMSLYNNGFAGGFIAAFLVPIFDTLRHNHHAYD